MISRLLNTLQFGRFAKQVAIFEILHQKENGWKLLFVSQHNFFSLNAGASNNPFPNAAPGVQPAKQKNPATLQMRARLVPDSERISELFLCRIPK